MWWYNSNNTSQRKLGSFALYESPTSYALFNDNDFSYCNSNDCNNNRCMRNKKNRWFNLTMNSAIEKGKNFIFSEAEYDDICSAKNNYTKASYKTR